MMALLLVWLKFIHVGTIALWSAGLIALPVLFRARNDRQGTELYRLHAFTRFYYVKLVSPAAFVAVASGTGLIFLAGTYDIWFIMKLAVVAALTGIHIFSGLVILRLFEPDRRYRRWRAVAGMSFTVVVVSSILVLVLGKPEIVVPEDVATFFAPGALSQHVEDITGIEGLIGAAR